jgi:hypothetical protein
VPELTKKKNQESGFTVLGEESMRSVIVSGFAYAEPDSGLMTLRFAALAAIAVAAYLLILVLRIGNQIAAKKKQG